MNEIVISKEYVDRIVEMVVSKKITPLDGSDFFVLKFDNSRIKVTDEIKTYAIDKKVLINPTRQDLLRHAPRQLYYCDHMFDKKENGSVIIEKKEVFWEEHEESYNKWLEDEKNKGFHIWP